MSERRYSEAEIAAIFRVAAERPQPEEQDEAASAEGLTLAQLQAIGGEVGLSAEAIASAAQTLQVQPVRARAFLGFPLAVSHTVQLDRRLTDDEWDRLVVQLREVFGAQGRLRADGSLRQWSNGNLRVHLEPTERGHRLRFGTTHSGARAGIAAGLILLATAGITTLVTAMTGSFTEAVTGIGAMTILGVLMIANRALRLPRWARTRAQQMTALGERLLPPSA